MLTFVPKGGLWSATNLLSEIRLFSEKMLDRYRLAGKRSIVDLAGVLSSKEEVELSSEVREIRTKSRRRLNGTTRRIKRS